MGGQANVTSNSWGALEWSQGNWGAQSDDSAQATGIQSTFNIGSVTNSGDANITPSGIQLSSSQGASVIRFDANITVSGIQFSSVVGTTGEATIDHTLSVTGSQLASSIGSASGEGIIQVGWGGDTWAQGCKRGGLCPCRHPCWRRTGNGPERSRLNPAHGHPQGKQSMPPY
jgi:hypothetical protein